MINNWLSSVDNNDFEIVVCDNVSSDGSFEKIAAIQDSRLRVFKNAVNVGSLGNSISSMTRARGKYVMLLMDKDVIHMRNISKIIDILSSLDVAAGRFVLNSNEDENMATMIIRGRHSILRKEGLRFAHPSGYFFNSEKAREYDIFHKVDFSDSVAMPYSTDFYVLMAAKYGDFAVLSIPFVELQHPPFEGLTKSFTYKQNKRLFFLPEYRIDVFTEYVRMMRQEGVCLLSRIVAIDRMLSRLSILCTKNYLELLAMDNICEWYGLDADFRNREKSSSLLRRFFTALNRKSREVFVFDAICIRLGCLRCCLKMLKKKVT